MKKRKGLNKRKNINASVVKNRYKKVQVIGMFNTGSNLVSKLIDSLFNVNIHREGHTLWWKHSIVSQDFFSEFKDRNAVYVVVVKNPYWWFHSVYKAPYGINVEDENTTKIKNIEDFINKNIHVKIPPKNKHKYNKDMMNFENLPDYWSIFYENALNNLPPENTVIVRYVDVMNNINKVINDLKKKIPLKRAFTLSRNPEIMSNTINVILSRPAKSHGNPRYGKEALNYYQLQNIPKLFKKDTFNWLATHLNKNIVEKLNYKIV